MSTGNTRSPLTKPQNDRRNTKGGREEMAATSFAIPESRKYRIDDLPHARNALARVEQFGSEDEKRKVKAAVYAKYPSLKPSS